MAHIRVAILTVSGTGFADAIAGRSGHYSPLNRPAPGLVHLLLSPSLQHTPLAALSRSVAGIIKSTLITTLPGSVKAVKSNMDALMRGGVHANIEVLPVETQIVDNNLREHICRRCTRTTRCTSSFYNERGWLRYSFNRLSRSIQGPHPLPHRNPSRRHHLPNQHRQPTPPGTGAVIMVEDTHLASTDNETEEGTEVETLARIPVGENVRLPGSNVRRGDNVILSENYRARRRSWVRLYRKPVVAILSTGNELMDLQTREASPTTVVEGWGGIFDTNRLSLRAVLENMDMKLWIWELCQISKGFKPTSKQSNEASDADMILTTGGTSMGPTDLKPVIEPKFGGTVDFGRVTVKPGKPTTFATIPFEDGEGRRGKKPIFALLGNPASALVMFYVFVVPALRKMGGWTDVSVAKGESADPTSDVSKPSNGVAPRCHPGRKRLWGVESLQHGRTEVELGNGFVLLPPLGLTETKVADVGTVLDAIILGELEMK
ncbi:hypothetical protein K443DRAFT_3486 [Laccaria amethystina LaAM-08-1]|uniref:MoaB/Mog domain-containing protein n=1 Tax=Laccaria amethystina LaAM-08-1 TaxID=1095629 RepID=A0A0C9YCL6_9AGAR|nr:hypothetical protein K443DRAFT_3486 [Laccaria amethystina LaAM-08-1]